MSIKTIEHEGIKFAEIIRADLTVDKTTFFSPPESSFQFGLLAHKAGYQEEPHYHQTFERTIKDLQQMFIVQKGIVAVQLYTDSGILLEEIILKQGDAIVLIHGSHAIKIIEDMQCISIKQGPFLGTENDKVEIKIKNDPCI